MLIASTGALQRSPARGLGRSNPSEDYAGEMVTIWTGTWWLPRTLAPIPSAQRARLAAIEALGG